MNHQDTKAPRALLREKEDGYAKQIVDAAFQVHSRLGPGLLESVYERCLIHELGKRSVPVQSQVRLPIVYDGVELPESLRLDLLVGGCVIVELKSVETLGPIHSAQVLSYLRLSKLQVALLINFNVPVIRWGIKRLSL